MFFSYSFRDQAVVRPRWQRSCRWPTTSRRPSRCPSRPTIRARPAGVHQPRQPTLNNAALPVAPSIARTAPVLISPEFYAALLFAFQSRGKQTQSALRHIWLIYLVCVYRWCRSFGQEVERLAPRVFYHGDDVDGGRGGPERGSRARCSAHPQVHPLPGAPRGHALRPVSQCAPSQVLLPLQPGQHQAPRRRFRGRCLSLSSLFSTRTLDWTWIVRFIIYFKLIVDCCCYRCTARVARSVLWPTARCRGRSCRVRSRRSSARTRRTPPSRWKRSARLKLCSGQAQAVKGSNFAVSPKRSETIDNISQLLRCWQHPAAGDKMIFRGSAPRALAITTPWRLAGKLFLSLLNTQNNTHIHTYTRKWSDFIEEIPLNSNKQNIYETCTGRGCVGWGRLYKQPTFCYGRRRWYMALCDALWWDNRCFARKSFFFFFLIFSVIGADGKQDNATTPWEYMLTMEPKASSIGYFFFSFRFFFFFILFYFIFYFFYSWMSDCRSWAEVFGKLGDWHGICKYVTSSERKTARRY